MGSYSSSNRPELLMAYREYTRDAEQGVAVFVDKILKAALGLTTRRRSFCRRTKSSSIRSQGGYQPRPAPDAAQCPWHATQRAAWSRGQSSVWIPQRPMQSSSTRASSASNLTLGLFLQ